MIYKIVLCLIIYWTILQGCQDESNAGNEEMDRHVGTIITDGSVQDSLFSILIGAITSEIDDQIRKDSLSFLILPVQASCPSCRNKTMDSIIKYKDRLDKKHIVIISGSDKKTISGYFEQVDKKCPSGKGIFLDTLSHTISLSSTNPNVYYSSNEKVYRKVSCKPSTIKIDLKEFFAGM